ncbi:MAG: tRNA (adenosine(37)-N6)-dimethylallyltransferase MiaA [Candidatus Puniceispirillaceae bacterium]
MSNAAWNTLDKQNLLKYIMIAGPTASGKSQLAVDLARALDGEVINADSMQLYSDLSILTARPSSADMRDIVHHLYGVIDGAQRASVAVWLGLAAEAMAAIRERGRIPIIIGGTGMYLNAAVNGIAPIPNVPVKIHNAVTILFQDIGGAAFRQKLAALDPTAAAWLVDGDRQRLIRAMGVVTATGTPLSEWQAGAHEGALVGRPIKLAIMRPREILYQRIDDRFDLMLESGVLEEVSRLAKRRLDPTLPLMKALGLSALISSLNKEITLEEAVCIGKRDSRHYAKRQMTWLRNNFSAHLTVNKKLSKSLLENIFSLIR